MSVKKEKLKADVKKKRFKLVHNGKLAYGVATNCWTFVNKVPGGYEALATPMRCKDYMHEAICNRVHNSELYSCTGHGVGKKINIDKFQIAMFFNKTDELFKVNLYSVKKYINSLEKANNVTQTTIIEIDSGLKDCRCFVITAPKAYIKSPGLAHGLVAMLRTLHHAEKRINKTNVEETLSNLHYKDNSVLAFVIKHGVYDKLLKHHDRIVKGLSLKEIYPKKVTNVIAGNNIASYHGGYGMVAICTQKIASKAYSDRVIEVLTEEKVPKYRGY